MDTNNLVITNNEASDVYMRIANAMSDLNKLSGRVHAVRLAAFLISSGAKSNVQSTITESNVRMLRDEVMLWCFDKSLIEDRSWWNIYLNVVTLTLMYYNAESVIERSTIASYFTMIWKLIDIKYDPGTELHNHRMQSHLSKYTTNVIHKPS